MPEITITIGGRPFEVACQEGEESYLHAAAKMLDDEAQVLNEQVGRMLLMSGLMLADKSASIDDKMTAMRAEMAALQEELATLKAAPVTPDRIEVPVVPQSVTETLAELAARAEALAAEVEEKLG